MGRGSSSATAERPARAKRQPPLGRIPRPGSSFTMVSRPPKEGGPVGPRGSLRGVFLFDPLRVARSEVRVGHALLR